MYIYKHIKMYFTFYRVTLSNIIWY